MTELCEAPGFNFQEKSESRVFTLDSGEKRSVVLFSRTEICDTFVCGNAFFSYQP